MSIALVIGSLSLIIPGFEGMAISLNMSGFLAIVAGSIITGLTPASRISRLLRRTSSLVVRSVS